MANLFEGLKEGDLEELVLPMVSIDEYESKLDDDSIVVAFFVYDKDPAQDLNRFIQKGATSILDTDVSPAPNEDGYYLVFVELLRDAAFPEKLTSILGTLQGLTGIENWKAIFYEDGSIGPITQESIAEKVRLVSHVDDEEQVQDAVEESLNEFFRASDLEALNVEHNRVVIEARGVVVELDYVDLGSFEAVAENNAVMASATRLDESANANCRRVQRMLGDFWLVEQRGQHLVLGTAAHDIIGLFALV